MKKTIIIVVLIVAVALLFMFYMGMFQKIDIVKEKKGPYTIAYVEYVGPYSGVAKPMKELDDKMRAAGFSSTDGIGIYYSDPKTTPENELKSDVGSIITIEDMGKIEANRDKIKFKTLEEGEYYVAEFPIRNMLSYVFGAMKVWPAFSKYLEDNGLKAGGPGIEVYDMKAKKIYFLMMANDNTDSESNAADKKSTSTSVAKEYIEGVDYSLDYPEDYFVENPKVNEVACDFAAKCPCAVEPGYEDVADFCQRIAVPAREGDMCLQKWSEGAAGSIYTTYLYTKPLPNSSDRCVVLRLVKRTVNSCTVYDGNDPAVKNCEAENEMVPVMIDQVVSSWKLLYSPVLE